MKHFLILLLFLPLIGFSQSQPHMMHALASQDSGSGEDLLTGLISCWEMDDGSGTTLTDANSNYDLTLVGNPTWGTHPNSVIYDGNDYATAGDIQNGLNPASAHSISVWFRKNGNSASSSSHQNLFSRYWSQSGYQHYYLSIIKSTHATVPNFVYFSYYDSNKAATTLTYDPESNIWLETWHHIVVTRDGSTLKLYLDGSYIKSITGGNGSQYQNTSVTADNMSGAMAKSSTIPDAYFKGNMGQTAVWSVALTSDQVTALYNDGNGIAYTNF